ncbi:Phosphoserine phosphatase [Actinomyces bovis]|uniref:Phosphoserine phosphatase n=1 Tax=Actinomyces bovis TaxID=1658 RepID=A0ABY1VQ77_9ACTO|nr:HAD family hydrolase [Actinomyces bovis]SPT54285.1 Phosphoserine phosphatase [Actinomyces bovis]VEG56383.1 Phosphoserine phosphatase [Actinomyces israelii]
MEQPRRVAAYFDLDKTLLSTSTTMALSTPMRRHGIISAVTLIRGVVTQLPYLLAGADEEQTTRMMTRLAAMSAGVERERVLEVVREALPTSIEPAFYAEALEIVTGHHRAGHDVVVVSASIEEMVEPVARLVGADRCVATRMEAQDGVYTGRIERSLLHAEKVVALREDAERHGIDLSRSWAYSDSISDLPMLEAVGHPVATNPDRELRAAAAERGWPVRDFVRPTSRRRLPRPHLSAPSLPTVSWPAVSLPTSSALPVIPKAIGAAAVGAVVLAGAAAAGYLLTRPPRA